MWQNSFQIAGYQDTNGGKWPTQVVYDNRGEFIGREF